MERFKNTYQWCATRQRNGRNVSGFDKVSTQSHQCLDAADGEGVTGEWAIGKIFEGGCMVPPFCAAPIIDPLPPLLLVITHIMPNCFWVVFPVNTGLFASDDVMTTVLWWWTTRCWGRLGRVARFCAEMGTISRRSPVDLPLILNPSPIAPESILTSRSVLMGDHSRSYPTIDPERS